MTDATHTNEVRDETQQAVPGASQAMEGEVLQARAESLALAEEEQVSDNHVSVLMFSLGDEWYGVRIGDVREIYNEYLITPVPCVPDHILGVMNIRGEIVSVTDLRALLGLGAVEIPDDDEKPPVIIVMDQGVCTALLVDAIGDIADVPLDGLEPPVAVWDKTQSEYIAGAFYTGDRLVALVNLVRVLAPVGGETR